MKKIQNFSIVQIIKKRNQSSNKNRSRRNIIQIPINNSPAKFQDEKQLNFDQILFQTLDKIQSKGPQSLNNEQKNKLIELVSKKTGLSLNKQKIIPKMTIKQVKHINIVEKICCQSKLHKQKQKDIRSIFKSKQNNQNQHQHQLKKSYFLLSGSMSILSCNPFDRYKIQNKESISTKKLNQIQNQPDYQQFSKQTIFFNKKQLFDQFPNYFQLATIQQQTGFGNLFDCCKKAEQQKQIQKQEYKNNSITFSTTQPVLEISQKSNAAKSLKQLMSQPKLLICQNAIFIQIQGTQYDDQYINGSGLSVETIQDLVESFKVFFPLGKKIKNYIQFFEFKQFHKNQKIYQANDKADKFYLLIKGEVVFQTKQLKNSPESHNQNGVIRNVSPQRSHSNSINQFQYCLKTQTLSAGSYFGQQQLIYQIDKRSISAICKSSYCQVLFIPKQYFQKMMEYSDFADLIKKAAKIKAQQRQQKILKSNSIRNKFSITQYNQDKINQLNVSIPPERQTLNLFRSTRGSVDAKYKVMHGNIIKTFTKDKNAKINEDVQFSMLAANPDMYESTLKKFRKFKEKVPDRKKAQINWKLQRVWKVLNLQNILREDAEVSSPEGRKYYDSHKRFVNQISQSKSLRPKTSSTTYRTKLQYIAYLQQFKN